MSSFTNFTSGGQVKLNNLRMLFQVANKVICLSLSVFILSAPAFWFVKSPNPFRELYLVKQKRYAEFCKDFTNLKCRTSMEHKDGKGKVFFNSATDILFIPEVLLSERRFIANLKWGAWAGGGCAIAFFLILTIYLIRSGLQHNTKKLLKGSELLSIKAYTKVLNKAKLASDLVLGGVPLAKETETQHILIHGSPGCGKTVCMNQLLEQIRAKGQKAIVYDIKGTFVPAYYRPDKDIILNPLDERSPSWNLWNECRTLTDYDFLAASIVPEKANQIDPFWSKAARLVLSNMAQEFANDPSINMRSFLPILFSTPLKQIANLLKSTMAEHMVKQESERMAYSVMATLASDCASLLYLKDDGRADSFSIRDWIKSNDDSWLFVNSNLKDSHSVKPIISFWLNMAIQHLLSLNEDRTRRLWFFFDEFARLQRLPSLETLLSMGRGYGACFVGAVQDINQLRDIYGDKGADSLVGSFGTKIFFASNSAKSSDWAANELSKVEILEPKERYSMGAHQMRDGRTLDQERRQDLLVLPCEIMKLPKLTAFSTTMGVGPIVKLKFNIKNMANNHPAIVERDLSKLSFKLTYNNKPELNPDPKSPNDSSNKRMNF